MKKDVHFWLTTLVRGLVALAAGSAILIIPDMARTLLLLPMAMAVSILGLAAYGVVDSTLILISSFMAVSPRAKLALRLQGALGIAIGTLLLSVVYERVRLEWFLTLIAIQALSAAAAEFVAARHATDRAITIWDYAAAAIAFCFGCTYAVLRISVTPWLTANEISWLVYGYLVAFGVAQCLTAARMLYADRRATLVMHNNLVRREA